MAIYIYNSATQEYELADARRPGRLYKTKKNDEYELTPAEQAARQQEEADWSSKGPPSPSPPNNRALAQAVEDLAARVAVLEVASSGR